MNKSRLPSEFAFQVLALLAAVIVVHAFYVGLIRPSADAQLAAQAALQASGEAFVPERSLYVVIRDFEQEACFILMIWALAIMSLKAWATRQETAMLDRNLIQVTEGTTLLPQDARNYSRAIEALPEAEQDLLLPRTLLNALSRFSTTGSIPAVSEAVREQCDIEADKLDSELSMVRYISWAIPSIGFIGTVRGIGDALGQAYKAVEGDISGVTVSLGVAFNSTFVALVLSIIIMFALHQLQLSQERLVLRTQRYADKQLIRHLAAPNEPHFSRHNGLPNCAHCREFDHSIARSSARGWGFRRGLTRIWAGGLRNIKAPSARDPNRLLGSAIDFSPQRRVCGSPTQR